MKQKDNSFSIRQRYFEEAKMLRRKSSECNEFGFNSMKQKRIFDRYPKLVLQNIWNKTMKKIEYERKSLQISTYRRQKQSLIITKKKNSSSKVIIGHPRVWYKKKGAKDDYNINYGNYLTDKMIFSKATSLEKIEESKCSSPINYSIRVMQLPDDRSQNADRFRKFLLPSRTTFLNILNKNNLNSNKVLEKHVEEYMKRKNVVNIRQFKLKTLKLKTSNISAQRTTPQTSYTNTRSTTPNDFFKIITATRNIPQASKQRCMSDYANVFKKELSKLQNKQKKIQKRFKYQ